LNSSSNLSPNSPDKISALLELNDKSDADEFDEKRFSEASSPGLN
jgi:hypothetical protein